MIFIMLGVVLLLLVTATAVNINQLLLLTILNYKIMKKFKTIKNVRVKNVSVEPDDYIHVHTVQDVIPAFFPNEEVKDKKINVIRMRKASFLNDLKDASFILGDALLCMPFDRVMNYFKKARIVVTVYIYEKGEEMTNPRFKRNDDYPYSIVENEKYYSYVITDVELKEDATSYLITMLKK